MDSQLNISYVDFGMPYTWDAVIERLKKEDGFRLPNIGEAIMMDYTHQAIWIEDKINGKNCVMDVHWGIQIVKDGAYGLILMEK